MPDSLPDTGPGESAVAPAALLLRVAFGVLGLVSLIAGYLGLARYLHGHPEMSSAPLDILYYDLQLFVLGSPPLDDGGPFNPALDLARFAAPAVTAYALAEAARALFATELRRWRTRRLRGHVIVCGDGMLSGTLVRRLRADGERVVLIPSEAVAVEPPTGPGTVSSSPDTRVSGAARDPDALRAAGIARARVLYACTTDSATNTAIALAAARAVRQTPLAVYAHVDDPEFGLALQARVLGTVGSGGIQLTFFNVDDLAARRLLAEQPPVPVPGGPPRIVLIGASNFGQAVLVELARRWRRSGLRDEAPIRLALVDERATAVAADLAYRYPFLAVSCRITPVDGGLPELLGHGSFPLPPDRVYICRDDDEWALKTALLTEQLWHPGPGSIVVRLERLASLREVFDTEPDYLLGGAAGAVRPYGVVQAACDPRLIGEGLVERLGRAIHQAYVLDRRRQGDTPATNPALRAWEELPAPTREANREQARDIARKLARVGCALYPRVGPSQEYVLAESEVELLAQLEHQRWSAVRRSAGWRYAERRDDERRLHPALTDWGRLPDDMRERNYSGIRELPEILADAGFRIVRVRAT
ncbi:RyR domain-containing protein [Plantactinospora sp. KBS50]|uniref:RyR domain-containing protein n=1 Tax=Plantactinospora sp. KBS50 TaxID=2024580 RepID=UPI0012FE447B|nr:RyR domain-containing protein [Plantactinospora sp. KBS50]